MELSLVLGAGCFWGVEVLFEEMNGVNKVISGYSGGHTNNPTYEQVCTGETGHIEVVKIDYDSSVVTFSELLDKFFFIHDPTSVNRQGPDVGTQYRSVIFYNSDEEKEIAEKKIKEINESGEYDKEVATDLRESVEFYEAEEYHQDFVEKNPNTTFDDLKKAFPDEWHADKPNQRNRAVFVRLSDAEQLFKDKGHRRHFFKEGEPIQLSDEIIAVSNQWGIGNIGNFVDGANQTHNAKISKMKKYFCKQLLIKAMIQIIIMKILNF